MTKKTEYRKQKDREYEKRKRQEQGYTVYISCRVCGEPSPTKKYKERLHLRKGGITCKKCMSEASAKRFREMNAALSDKDRSEKGKAARACVLYENLSRGVKKQCAHFRAYPEK